MMTSAEGWLHPYLFMRWLGEMNVPQWLAAAGSFTASVVALNLARINHAKSIHDRRQVAVMGLKQSAAYLLMLDSILRKAEERAVADLTRWLKMASDGADYALKQNVPDMAVLDASFSILTLSRGMEDIFQRYPGDRMIPEAQTAIADAWKSRIATLVERVQRLPFDPPPDPDEQAKPLARKAR